MYSSRMKFEGSNPVLQPNKPLQLQFSNLAVNL